MLFFAEKCPKNGERFGKGKKGKGLTFGEKCGIILMNENSVIPILIFRGEIV